MAELTPDERLYLQQWFERCSPEARQKLEGDPGVIQAILSNRGSTALPVASASSTNSLVPQTVSGSLRNVLGLSDAPAPANNSADIPTGSLASVGPDARDDVAVSAPSPFVVSVIPATHSAADATALAVHADSTSAAGTSTIREATTPHEANATAQVNEPNRVNEANGSSSTSHRGGVSDDVFNALNPSRRCGTRRVPATPAAPVEAPADPLLLGTAARSLVSCLPPSVGYPQGPVVYLAHTDLSSANYLIPLVLAAVAGTDQEPTPLNLVVRMIKNHFNKSIGRTAFRLAMVDIGDGRETRLIIKNNSNFYLITKEFNPHPANTLAMLWNISAYKSNGRIILEYGVNSRIFKFRNELGVTWNDVLEWHDAIDESRAPQNA